MIEVKLTFATQAELVAFFADAGPARTPAPQLVAVTPALNDIPAEVQEAAAPRKTRKSKNAEAEQAQAAPAAVAPEQEATAEPEVVAEPTAEASDKSYTVDDVRKALQDYSHRTDFPTAAALVKTFTSAAGTPATRVTELKPEDYAAFIAKTTEQVAA
jgi:hypothetical protein